MIRTAILNSLLVLSVTAGADVHQFDRRDGGGRGDADGSIDGGPREGRRGGHVDNGRGGRGPRHPGPGRGGYPHPRRPDPNPYDPRHPGYPDYPGRPGYPGYPDNGGGWGETQRALYVNQVFQNQYVDLNYLAGGIINTMYGYGLVGVDIEVANQWGPAIIRLVVNGAQIDVEQIYTRYVQLNTYQPIDLNYGNRVNLGFQGRVHVGQMVLHFRPLGRR